MWRWIHITLILLSLIICVSGSVFWVRSLFLWEWVGVQQDMGTEAKFTINGDAYQIASLDQRMVLSWIRITNFSGVDPETVERHWNWDSMRNEYRPFEELTGSWQADATTSFGLLGFQYFHSFQDPLANLPQSTISVSYVVIAIPYWFTVPLSAICPLWWFFRGSKKCRGYRLAQGLCVGCGYDLKETRDQCPECGQPVERVKPARTPRQ